MKLTLFITFFFPLFASAIPWKSANSAREFAPQNNLHISVEQNFSGVTEEEFSAVLDNVFAVYEPIFKEKGAKLIIERNWTDDTVNAYAYQNGNDWFIAMYGGLARHEETTVDGFALVACHELGHHVGGFPKSSWASNEGQSDYYGSLKCLRKVWANDDNIKIVSNMDIDPVAKSLCDEQWGDEADSALCQRGSMAGLSLGRLLAVLGGESMPKFDTPDDKVTQKTNDAHPAAQCRLDTYFAGSVCIVDHMEETSSSDPDQGVCSRTKGTNVGARPKCWYARPTFGSWIEQNIARF